MLHGLAKPIRDRERSSDRAHVSFVDITATINQVKKIRLKKSQNYMKRKKCVLKSG